MESVRKIPVFVYPGTIKFYLSSRATHKQLLTLYNPYEFPVRFKVLCTAPNKYSVTDPEGSIGPYSCVDIVIRHNLPLAANCNVIDKFRITMQDHTTRKLLGKKDVEATLLQGEQDNISTDGGDNFQSLPYDKGGDDQRSSEFSISQVQRYRTSTANSTNFIAIIAGVVCILALLLPTQREQQPEYTSIPGYLHLSFNMKLVFAYVLGLVSMVVFRP